MDEKKLTIGETFIPNEVEEMEEEIKPIKKEIKQVELCQNQ